MTDRRSDSELLDLDVEAAITRGLCRDGAARHLLLSDAAIAGSWKAERLGAGPRPIAFLARCVRTMGISGALELPEPLIGDARTSLARDWLIAALDAGRDDPEVDDLFARWLDRVALLLAFRRGHIRNNRPAY
jgi:hypothetical protein